MTRAELVDAGADHYQRLKQKIRESSDDQERRLLQLEIITLLEAMLYVITRMKHLS